MRKLISFIIITLLLCIFTTSTFASNTDTNEDCAVKLVNNTNTYYAFWLKWIDHPYLHQTKGKPWIKVCAEIAPGKSFSGESRHAPGLYTVICQERWKPNAIEIIRNIAITAKTKTIIIILAPDDNKDPIILIFKHNK